MFCFQTICSTGCLFLVVQKPLTSGQPLTETQWLQTVYLGVGRVMVSVLWFYGISLSGPFRAILVCEQYDIVVVAGFAALTSNTGGSSAFRGALTFLIGLLVLLFLDHDEGNLHPDNDHSSSWIGLADHKVRKRITFSSLIKLFACLSNKTVQFIDDFLKF